MTDTLSHGGIMGGVVTTPDLDAALRDYRDTLGLELVETRALDRELAAAWGCPASASSSMATLRPKSGAPCFIRLVEQPIPPGFVPTRSFGWASYEINCRDVFGWPDKIAGSGFEVVGPPREIEGLPYFVAMQVLGAGKEMLYFNEVRSNTPSSDLPFAASDMDHIFIVILATPDRARTVAWYRDRIGLDEGGSYTIEYTMLNTAFDLPAGTQSTLTMVQKGRLPIIEVDDYPEAATIRPREPGTLPPGNALVSLGVDSLDALALEWIAPPVARPEAPYQGRRAATVIGPAGELLELIEIG